MISVVNLENEDLVMQLADRVWNGVLDILKVFFHGGDHGRGSANEKLAVSGGRIGKELFDMLFSDEANTTFPARRRVVEDVVDGEFQFINIVKFLKVIPEKDVFLVNVSVDESNGGAVERVPQGSADDLNHRGNTSSTGDHAEMTNRVGGVSEVALWTFDPDAVTNLQSRNIFGDVALLVALDNEVEVATVVVVADGGVAPYDFLATNVSRHRDMLSDREA